MKKDPKILIQHILECIELLTATAGEEMQWDERLKYRDVSG